MTSENGGCMTCAYLGKESEGWENGGGHEWHYCTRHGQMYGGTHSSTIPDHLPNFPYKKTRKCHRLDFWASKFAERIDLGPKLDSSMKQAIDEWELAHPDPEPLQ